MVVSSDLRVCPVYCARGVVEAKEPRAGEGYIAAGAGGLEASSGIGDAGWGSKGVGGCAKAELARVVGRGQLGEVVGSGLRGRWGEGGRPVDGHLSGPGLDWTGPRGWRHGRPQLNWDGFAFAAAVALLWPCRRARDMAGDAAPFHADWGWALGGGAHHRPRRHGLEGNLFLFRRGCMHVTHAWSTQHMPPVGWISFCSSK